MTSHRRVAGDFDAHPEQLCGVLVASRLFHDGADLACIHGRVLTWRRRTTGME